MTAEADSTRTPTDEQQEAYRLALGERIDQVVQLFEKRSDAAEAMGVSPNQLRLYREGTQTPRGESLVRLADAQNVSLEWLLRGEGTMHRVPAMAQASLVEEAVYKVETFLDRRDLEMGGRKKGELVAAVMAYMQRDIRDGTPWQQADEFLEHVWSLRPDA